MDEVIIVEDSRGDVLEDPDCCTVTDCRGLLLICVVDEPCDVKEEVFTTLYVIAADGLDVTQADGIADAE